MADYKNVTWNELTNLKPSEMKNKYKLTDRQLEQSVRKHLDGANVNERRQVYENVYNLKDKS